MLISGTTSGVEDRKSPHELGNAQWWTQGYLNWDGEEFARRLRINRATFDYLLAEIGQLIEKVPCNRNQFPIEEHRQIALTIYHGRKTNM